MNDEANPVGNVATTRARKRKMTFHRIVWAGLVMFGLALVGVAVLQAMGITPTEPSDPLTAPTSDGSGVSPAGSGIPAQPRWTGVLAFGAVVAGIGLLGFTLSGGFGAVVDFMRLDP